MTDAIQIQHEFFYATELQSDYFIFKVENSFVLYKLPRDRLQDSSKFWLDTFIRLKEEGSSLGKDDDQPWTLALPGNMLTLDLDCLLSVVFPSYELNISTNSPVNTVTPNDYWLAILKLSTVWEMDALRLLAIRQFPFKEMRDNVERMRIAAHPLVSVQSWLVNACVALHKLQIQQAEDLAMLHKSASGHWSTWQKQLLKLGQDRDIRFADTIIAALELEFYRVQYVSTARYRLYDWEGKPKNQAANMTERFWISLRPVLFEMNKYPQPNEANEELLRGDYWVWSS